MQMIIGEDVFVTVKAARQKRNIALEKNAKSFLQVLISCRLWR